MTRKRWMALCFAAGSLAFLIGPFLGTTRRLVVGSDPAATSAGVI